jgi:hypothetical protein
VAKRNVIPLDLPKGKSHLSITGDAKAVISTFAKKHGMKEIALASRVYLWFSQQDDVVQKAVLDLLPEGYELDVVEIVLRRRAEASQRKHK